MSVDGWTRGWSAILEHTGYKNSDTVKNLVNKYGFPLYHLPSGEPAIIISEVNEWLRQFSEASSPFLLRKLTGAALLATQGINRGAVVMGERRKKQGVVEVDWEQGTGAYAQNS